MDYGDRRARDRVIDYSGTIGEAQRVTRFKPGDQVFGGRKGALGEYVVATERLIVPKPDNVTFEQAAAVPIAGLDRTVGALRDKGRVKPGQRVLISRGIGRRRNLRGADREVIRAHVTGVCSTRNVDLGPPLGADAVVDYTNRSTRRRNGTTSSSIRSATTLVSIEPPRPQTARDLRDRGRSCKGKWIAPIDRF